LPARPGVEPDRLFLRLAELVEATRSAHADLDRVGLKVLVLRLSRVGGHRDSLVADTLDLVDRASFGQGAAGGVVTDERQLAHRSPPPNARAAASSVANFPIMLPVMSTATKPPSTRSTTPHVSRPSETEYRALLGLHSRRGRAKGIVFKAFISCPVESTSRRASLFFAVDGEAHL
jgi:hypothetical protein